MLEQVRNEAKAAALEICQVAKLRKGQILVVGQPGAGPGHL